MKIKEENQLSDFAKLCINCKGNRFFDLQLGRFVYKYELFASGYKSFDQIINSSRFKVSRMPVYDTIY